MKDSSILEPEIDADARDPDEIPPKNRTVITQPYDLVVESLATQIEKKTLFLQPSFQRGYVWPIATASKLIESILLSIPIPPCYLSQNDNFEIDVIDGQQRLTSIHKFLDNQFPLTGLVVLSEYNDKRFFELPPKMRRKIETQTIRCIIISNESHPDIKFDVFERLNTNTIPLNAQELRNCIYRGTLNKTLREFSEDSTWLKIIGRKTPDKRMGDVELILRFYAFRYLGLESYRTPMKNWLNDAADAGRKMSPEQIETLQEDWRRCINNCLTWFEPLKCFRKRDSKAINKGIFDLVSTTAAATDEHVAIERRDAFSKAYYELLENDEYLDVVSRSIDHKKRTIRRFQIWNEKIASVFN